MKKNLREFMLFWFIVIKKYIENELFYMANALTYRMVMAFFPFLVVLLSLFGFLHLDTSTLFVQLLSRMPDAFQEIVRRFILDTYIGGTILSVSLLYGIWSATRGFYAIIRGMNRCCESEETRNFIVLWLLSFFLVFIFIAYLLLCLALVVFDDLLIGFMMKYSLFTEAAAMLKGLPLTVMTAGLTVVLVIIFYKFTAARRLSFFKLLPGAVFTIAAWIILSGAFSIYIKLNTRAFHFYGSIAGVFITIYWVNLLASTLLWGAQINGVLMEYKKYKKVYSAMLNDYGKKLKGKVYEKTKH